MKFAAIPPPREYPTREKEVLPVHEMGEDTRARRIEVVKRRSDCGRAYEPDRGVSE